mmetsp:Transcript_13578/g.21426  ORF Transcript_13578/g.21426 Transcript_13578/m.21426 type:complete len:97 (-) Transcript_13578:62-352(-)
MTKQLQRLLRYRIPKWQCRVTSKSFLLYLIKYRMVAILWRVVKRLQEAQARNNRAKDKKKVQVTLERDLKPIVAPSVSLRGVVKSCCAIREVHAVG